MDDLWGLSDLQFNGLFAALALAAVLIVRAARRHVTGPTNAWPVEALSLHLYEFAYLSGGPGTAATAAIARLRQAGVLGVAPEQAALVALREPPPGSHRLERATYEAVGEAGAAPPGAGATAPPGPGAAVAPASRLVSGRAVHRAVAGAPAMAEIQARLEQLGLVASQAAARRARRAAWLYLPLALAGLLRLAEELAQGDRDGGTLLLLALLAALLGLLAGGLRWQPPARKRAARALEVSRRRLREELDRQGFPGDLALRAVLLGPEALQATDPELAAVLLPERLAAGGDRAGP